MDFFLVRGEKFSRGMMVFPIRLHVCWCFYWFPLLASACCGEGGEEYLTHMSL